MADQTLTVTVERVYQPKRNPKFGSIKTKELGYVSVPVAKLGSFRDNSVCDIAYRTTESGYHNLVDVFPSVQHQSSGSKGSTHNDRLDMVMFVTGVVGRSMQSGNFSMADIKGLAAEARQAYERYLGPNATNVASAATPPAPPVPRPLPPSVRTVGQALSSGQGQVRATYDNQPGNFEDDEIPF